ncbi:MAG TPA: hypothetical protein VEA92_02510 [Candidatus Paceibacterota bacterium]|nr:hypothetical protein [Candidatus Paceibacterota bacterium]
MIRNGLKMLIAFSLPLMASAASFREIVNDEIVPFANSIIQLLYAFAFVFFLIGVVRYFINPNVEERQQGKAFMIWSMVGFFVLFGVWGLVRILLGILPT